MIVYSQAKRRTPAPCGGGPLSRDSQDKRSLPFVNKNFQDFCSHQLPAAKFWDRRYRNVCSFVVTIFNHVSYVERGRTISITLFHHPILDRTDLFRRLPRANIIFSDVENHVLNKLERMSQH